MSSLIDMIIRSVVPEKNNSDSDNAAQLRQPIENSLVLCHLKTLPYIQDFSSMSLTIT